MWVNKSLFQQILDDNREQQNRITDLLGAHDRISGSQSELKAQKAKDDMTIDWMRHRINALEKQNAILLSKAAGVSFPVPEIVPTRPGSMTTANFDYMPSFEDVGDAEAKRLGIQHDEEGGLVFAK